MTASVSWGRGQKATWTCVRPSSMRIRRCDAFGLRRSDRENRPCWSPRKANFSGSFARGLQRIIVVEENATFWNEVGTCRVRIRERSRSAGKLDSEGRPRGPIGGYRDVDCSGRRFGARICGRCRMPDAGEARLCVIAAHAIGVVPKLPVATQNYCSGVARHKV